MEQALSSRTKVAYGLADLGYALVTSAMQFFLLFYYTDVAGINPALAGAALLVAKLTWDAIKDPLIGYLSDRTHSRLGRRRIFMFAGAIPLALTAWLVFSLPKGLAGAAAFLAVMVSFWLVDTCLAINSTPYYALTPELTRDYSERASLTSVRMIFSVVGYILGAASTTLLVGLFKGAGLSLQGAWSLTGAVFGLVAMISTLVTALSIRERPELAGEPSQLPAVKAFVTPFKNRPFVILMASFVLTSFSFTVLTALVPYFIEYQLGMGSAVSLVLLVMLVTIGVFLVPAKIISDRINKGPAYALGLFIASAAIISSFFLPHHSSPIIYLIAMVAGIGFSGQWVFPWSMLPDVIEYDEKMTGERREGIYYGLWAFLSKFTGALGIAVSGWALQGFGYIPGVEQTTRALFGIRFFFAIVPAAVILISLPFLIWYPITRRSHARLVQELAERKAASQAPSL